MVTTRDVQAGAALRRYDVNAPRRANNNNRCILVVGLALGFCKLKFCVGVCLAVIPFSSLVHVCVYKSVVFVSSNLHSMFVYTLWFVLLFL